MEDDTKDDSTSGRKLEGNAIDDMGSPEFIPPPPDVPQSTPTKPSAFKPESKSSGPSFKNFSKSPSEKRSSIRSVPRIGSKSSKHGAADPIAELPSQEKDQRGSFLGESPPPAVSDLNPPSFERDPLNATIPSNLTGSAMPPSDVSGSMNVVPPTSINMSDQNAQNSLNYTGFQNVNNSTEPEFMTLNTAPPSNLMGNSNASNQPDFMGLPAAQAQPNSLEYSNAGNVSNLPGGQMVPSSPNINVAPNAAMAPGSPIMNAQPNAPMAPNTLGFQNIPGPPNAAMAPNTAGFQNIPGQTNAMNFQNMQGPPNNVGFQNMGAAQNGPDTTTYMGLGGGPTDANKSGGSFPCASALLQKRSPFIHNPPRPEERRPRIPCPRTPREYLINLREDLADFQESHGLPRTRDYSFVSLGLALAQETGRAIYSVFIMLTEMFPVLAIISLIMRFALDKLIEILETTETLPKVKKTVIFALEMLVIMIPLWILVGTIIIPLLSLLLSIIKRMLQIRGGKRKSCKSPNKTN